MNHYFRVPRVVQAAVAGWCLLSVSTLATAQQRQTPAEIAPQRLVTIGRLIRSGQARNGTPRYALLDDRGNLTAYVVPTAGMSLGHYLNQQVAVTARSVSRDADGLAYLLAQRVASVDGNGASDVAPPARPGGVDVDEMSMDDESYGGDEPRILGEPSEELVGPAAFESIEDSDLSDYDPAEEFDHDLAWGSGLARDLAVRPAARYQPEEISEPAEPVASAPMEMEEELAVPESVMAHGYQHPSSGCGNPNCANCSPCGPCTSQVCPCGPAGRFWFRADYLRWWTKAADAPPLVTTSPPGTPPQDAGVLDVPGTEVLIGGGDGNALSRDGVRFVLGGWIEACQHYGIEVDYFLLDEQSDDNHLSSLGAPILARPFFNTQLNMQDSELIAYPGIVTGTVAVDYRTKFQSLAPRFRHNLRCDNFSAAPCGGPGCWDDCGPSPCGIIGGSRVDWTIGYRYLKLEEELRISEDLMSQADNTFATFDLSDAFETSNEFNGLELGMIWDAYHGRWSMEFAGRFALGNNVRRVSINGATTSVVQGAAFQDVGGLLALPSNIGTYEDDEFVVIPEFSLTLGYQLAPRVRFLVGYTVVYWSNVARPGEQIDLNVNPDLLPPAMNTNGLMAPSFALNDTSFWAQGINLGLDWRW
jgi:hypothetical protein